MSDIHTSTLEALDHKLENLGLTGIQNHSLLNDPVARIQANNELALFIAGTRYKVLNRELSEDEAHTAIDARIQAFSNAEQQRRVHCPNTQMQGRKPEDIWGTASPEDHHPVKIRITYPASSKGRSTEAMEQAKTPPPPKDPAKGGIKVKLIDEHGKPIAGVPYILEDGHPKGTTNADGELLHTDVNESQFVYFNDDTSQLRQAEKHFEQRLSEVLSQLLAKATANAQQEQAAFDKKAGTHEIIRLADYAYYVGKGAMEGVASATKSLLEAIKKLNNIAGGLMMDPAEELQTLANEALETGHALVNAYLKVRLLLQDKECRRRFEIFTKKYFALCKHYPAYATESGAEFLGSGAIMVLVTAVTGGAAVSLFKGAAQELTWLNNVVNRLVEIKLKLAKAPRTLARYQNNISEKKAEVVTLKSLKVEKEEKVSRFEPLEGISSLTEATAALNRMRCVLSNTQHYVTKYTDAELLERAEQSEIKKPRFMISFMAKGERDSLHFYPEMSETGVGRIWMTDLDSIIECDSDPRLITALLGAPYDPEAEYELHIIDTHALDEGELGRLFSPTWEKVGQEGSEILSNVVDPKVFKSVMQESYKDTYFELMQQFWRWSDEQKKRWQVPLSIALRENDTTKLQKALRDLGIDKKDILKKDYISKLQNPATQDRTLSDLANSYSGFHQFNKEATKNFFNEALGKNTLAAKSAKTRHLAATETGCNTWFAGNGVTERDNRFLSKAASDLVPDKKYGAVEVLSIFRATKPELLDQEAPKLDALREKNALVTLPLTPIEGLK